MSTFNNQGELMGNWHKCPNIVTDRLIGQVISPNAGWVVMCVWRLTEGMQRQQAAIPTERFMTLLATKKKETAYKFVKEAVSSGLINVKKERGMVNIYSINKGCSLWNSSEVATKIEPTPQNGSTENRDYLDPKNGTRVVPQNGTGVVPKKGTLIKTKESIKDNTKEIEQKPKPKTQPSKDVLELIDFWNNNHDKGAASNVKAEVWQKQLNGRLKVFSVNDVKTAMLSIIHSHWHQQNNQVLIKNAISSDQRCEDAITRFRQKAAPRQQNRANDKLAVNNHWHGSTSNIVAANTNVEDMLGVAE